MRIYRNFLLGVFLTGMAFSSLAGEDAKHVMAVEVVGDGASDTTSFFLDSDDLGFDLEEMQVGETRSIIDESGQSILITRNEDGFNFNIDGKSIDLPNFGDESTEAMHWISADGDSNVDVRVLRDVSVETIHGDTGTVILTAEPIDGTTQQAIKSLLESAGYDSDVKFVDRQKGDNVAFKMHRVHKQVDEPQT